MTRGAGSLAIAARRTGSRTILERIRFDGISRCSRAFAHGNAALVVVSHLGPGAVRGDLVTSTGHIGCDAHLVVTQQTGLRLMGGGRTAASRASWSLATGATLELVGEPVIAAADARYEASTVIELESGARALISDVAAVPRGAIVRLRTSVRRDGREIFYDAFDPGAAAPCAVGTLAIIGLSFAAAGLVVAALDRSADLERNARLGVGILPTGAFARVVAADAWTVRSTLTGLRRAAWEALLTISASGMTPDADSSRALL